MKKVTMLVAALTFAFGTTMLAGCSEDVTEETTEQTEDGAAEADDADAAVEEETEDTPLSESAMYQCPEDCEEGRAYFEPGACKVCGAEMVEI